MTRTQIIHYELSWKKEPQTVAEICALVSHRPEFSVNSHNADNRKGLKVGDPPPQAWLERYVREELRDGNPKRFVKVGANLWRNRHHDACSFCLTEDVKVCRSQHGRELICFECAEKVVDTLRKFKIRDDQIAANEQAILSGQEMIGA
jgi:hypothetical protein